MMARTDERRLLARVHPSGVVTDTHHDGHGKRRMVLLPQRDGVLVSIQHTDGRSFRYLVKCKVLDLDDLANYDVTSDT
jgi:hypothetical protein